MSPSKTRLALASLFMAVAGVCLLTDTAHAQRKNKPTADSRVVARKDGSSPNSTDSKPGSKESTARAKADLKTDKGDKSEKGDKKGKKRKKHGSVPLGEKTHHVPSLSILKKEIKCPSDMVAVAGRLCVDRYESSLVEQSNGELLSSHYPPSAKLALSLLDKWNTERDSAAEGTLARTMELPALPDAHKAMTGAKAMAWPGNMPSGYVTGEQAGAVCKASGKRLCSEREWVTACRGEKQTNFPYGDKYRQDACNVFREDHPAHILHGSASQGHTDPRLNLVDSDGKPLLRAAGATSTCASKWGDDAIYDMVGNLDEWIDDPGGTFVGGFYARATRSGCDARVQNHPIHYFDYSTGVRCCKDPD